MNKGNSHEKSLANQVVTRRAWMVENAPRRDCAILRLEFPNIDFTVSANAAVRPIAAPSERAVTGAGGAVQRVITEEQRQELAQHRFQSEAEQNVQMAFDVQPDVSGTATAPEQPIAATSTAPVEEMTPEQIQFISDAQKRVQGVYDELNA
jgi:hypothetical protein